MGSSCSASYRAACEFLDSTLKFGIKPGLARVAELCNELGNPQQNYPSVLVAGTNGKTSTAKMISALLIPHKYAVGTYISPHLNSYRERVEVNGEKISERDFSETLGAMLPAIERANQKLKGDNLTNFEILTALAFFYFWEAQVDCAIMEVGMGGRWDATCLSQPEVSVITNVELDHTNFLGETEEKIALEKAFVIRKDGKAVVGPLSSYALAAVKKRIRKVRAKLFLYGEDFSLVSRANMIDKSQKIAVDGIYGKRYRQLPLSLPGRHQSINATLALAAAESFHGRTLGPKRIKEYLLGVECPGREEIVRRFPTIVLDGAHNPAGARELANSLQEEFEYDRLILILAVFEDKDIRGILEQLASSAQLTILSENKNNRCASVGVLKRVIEEMYLDNYVIEPDIKKAIDVAQRRAHRGDLICITGSFATVAEARNYLGQLEVRTKIRARDEGMADRR